MARLFHPEGFHGQRRRGRFFEGWYHKLVGPDGEPFALIPGWFQSADDANRFGFLMVFDGRAETIRVVRFPPEQFSAAADRYALSLGACHFSETRIAVDVDTPEIRLVGEVHCDDPKPWPITLRAPGVMGWYGYVPFMQCWHGIVSMDHTLRGSLEVDGRRVAFDGGRGYTEKDWGRSFPDAWVWVQGNEGGTSLTASVATIPWAFGSSFAGFLVGFLHEGELYCFTTYTGARIETLELDDERLRCVFVNRTHRLEIEASRSARTVLLPAPDLHDMVPKVPESLGVHLSARFATLGGLEVVTLQTTAGAMEVMGDFPRLKEMSGLG